MTSLLSLILLSCMVVLNRVLGNIQFSSSAFIPTVIRRKCGQTWTRVRVKYYNYESTTEER